MRPLGQEACPDQRIALGRHQGRDERLEIARLPAVVDREPRQSCDDVPGRRRASGVRIGLELSGAGANGRAHRKAGHDGVRECRARLVER
jgi:hypothetical protein